MHCTWLPSNISIRGMFAYDGTNLVVSTYLSRVLKGGILAFLGSQCIVLLLALGIKTPYASLHGTYVPLEVVLIITTTILVPWGYGMFVFTLISEYVTSSFSIPTHYQIVTSTTITTALQRKIKSMNPSTFTVLVSGITTCLTYKANTVADIIGASSVGILMAFIHHACIQFAMAKWKGTNENDSAREKLTRDGQKRKIRPLLQILIGKRLSI